MQLKVVLPTHVLIEEPAAKITAEAANGLFTLLPRHIDFVAALVPGILLFVDAAGTERYLGIDDGLLVKCADSVVVATTRAVEGADLVELERSVEQQFRTLDDQEAAARSALARLEAGVVRRFIELRER